MRVRCLSLAMLLVALGGAIGASAQADDLRATTPAAAGTSSAARGREPAPPDEETLPGDSLWRLSVSLETTEGRTLRLAELRGRPLLITLFYSRCTSVCPMLTLELQHFLDELPSAERDTFTVLMVSFDGEQDTLAALRRYKSAHALPASWLVARGSAHDVRTLAMALGVRYRRLADQSYAHSSLLTLIGRDGTVRARIRDLESEGPTLREALSAAD